jgi:glycosyltransferase involved in cell wall biosynthesis
VSPLGGRKKLHISVIVPIRDGTDSLRQCLTSLKRSDFPRFEVIVVDDCSKEDCSELVRSYGFKAVRLNKPRGAWYARNKGAQMATGEILAFVDGDMVVQPNALQRIHDRLSRSQCAAVSGVCGFETNSKKLVTWYKNLWMYYSYTNSPEDFDWFISGIGAVKREVFFGLKGFDATFQVKTGGGDLEFGRRLREKGQRIILDTRIRGKHLKQYTVLSLLRNDYNRGKGWFQLAVEKKILPYVAKKLRIANVYPAFIISVSVSLLCLFWLLLSSLSKIFLLLALLFALVYVMMNYRLFRFFRREAGFGFLLKAIPLSFVDHLVAGFGVISGCMGWLSSFVTRSIFRPKSKGRFAQEVPRG